MLISIKSEEDLKQFLFFVSLIKAEKVDIALRYPERSDDQSHVFSKMSELGKFLEGTTMGKDGLHQIAVYINFEPGFKFSASAIKSLIQKETKVKTAKPKAEKGMAKTKGKTKAKDLSGGKKRKTTK